jgi:hypothetical protein
VNVLERQLAIRDHDHEVVNPRIIGNIEDMSAAVDQDFNQKPVRPLVRIHKAMVANHAVKQGRRFARDCSVRARIGAGKRRLDQMQAADALLAAKMQRLVMRSGHRPGSACNGLYRSASRFSAALRFDEASLTVASDLGLALATIWPVPTETNRLESASRLTQPSFIVVIVVLLVISSRLFCLPSI